MRDLGLVGVKSFEFKEDRGLADTIEAGRLVCGSDILFCDVRQQHRRAILSLGAFSSISALQQHVDLAGFFVAVSFTSRTFSSCTVFSPPEKDLSRY
jgi:hypothetical protein